MPPTGQAARPPGAATRAALPGPETRLISDVRAALSAAGDPTRAADQQRYMKSVMPYHGVTLPQVRKLTRPILSAYRPTDRGAWEGAVRAMWDEATHREEWYVAIALARHRHAAPWQDAATLALYEHLVRTGAWWDVVDETAAHLVGGVLARDRTDVTPLMRLWATSEHLWLRRTAVLCQLNHKSETDTALLRAAIEANLEDSSFWLRKAIGWALRQHARTDPVWVRGEVERWGARLSPLSRKEALKHLDDRRDEDGLPEHGGSGPPQREETSSK